LRVALIGGPAYEPLYGILPTIERDLGVQFEVLIAANHAELNNLIATCIRRGELPFDVISTHIKYAPSQAEWLRPLDDGFDSRDLDPFVPDVLEHCRVGGELLQLPRLTDARLLHLDGRLFDDESLQARFAESHGQTLEPPQTWRELAEIAAFMHEATGRFGFAFPGNASGLFGTFFELMVSAGGQLVGDDGSVGLETPESIWALEFLRNLHTKTQLTPKIVPEFGFDMVSEGFRAGAIAMIGDWPAYLELHRDPSTSVVNQALQLERYPVGPAGKRAVYSGSHSFAITRSCRDVPAAVAFLRAMTSFDAQLSEARRGAFSPRRDVLAAITAESASDPLRLRQLHLLEATISEDMVMFPSIATYPKMEEAVAPLLMRAIHGSIDLLHALAQARAEVARFMQSG
jgi:multiple sugar transport system substrate-binding protein